MQLHEALGTLFPAEYAARLREAAGEAATLAAVPRRPPAAGTAGDVGVDTGGTGGAAAATAAPARRTVQESRARIQENLAAILSGESYTWCVSRERRIQRWCKRCESRGSRCTADGMCSALETSNVKLILH